MDHRMAHELVWMLEDQELSQTQRQEVLAHVETCGECSTRLTQWRAAQRLITRVWHPDSSEAFVASVMGRLPSASSPSLRPARVRWSVPWWLVQQIGMGVAGFVLAIGLVAQRPPIPVTTETLLMAGSPEGARWEFSRQIPDPALLLDVTKEHR